MEGNKSFSMVIPALGNLPAMSVSLDKTHEAEARLHEIQQQVNVATYSNLEYTFMESYRELTKAYASITYRLAKAEEAIENAKAAILLDKYPEFIKDKPAKFDNADMRNSFVQRDQEYLAATDQRDQIKAIEFLIHSRIKVMEKASSTIKKQMDILIRSGVSGGGR